MMNGLPSTKKANFPSFLTNCGMGLVWPSADEAARDITSANNVAPMECGEGTMLAWSPPLFIEHGGPKNEERACSRPEQNGFFMAFSIFPRGLVGRPRKLAGPTLQVCLHLP